MKRRSGVRGWQVRRWFIFAAMGIGLLVVFAFLAAGGESVVAGDPVPPANPTPLLSYYYIWFDPSSWDRAKTDYPLLGRYSSDDPAIMRRHIEWAKQAGIGGFIVSWKSTDVLNARLQKLVQVADAENFKLAIIYQGLDFYRNPLSADKVATDLDYVAEHYAGHPAFDLFDKPLVIWSGTWKFSREEIVKVTQPRRSRLLILASEKNVKGYQRIADAVDGDAYYWSSVNPDTFSGYADKLSGLAQAIHARQGLWIAPAAPGFDARLVGGTSVLDRQDGQVLRTEMDVALGSSPDAVGLISWNEFSENSQIEPSQKYGDRYLKVLADIRHAPSPVIHGFDSSEPADRGPLQPGTVAALVLLGSVFVGSGVLLAKRRAPRPPA